MPKRKPPSQRPERQMDETARAIARMREESKETKAADEDRPAASKSKPAIGPSGRITDRPKPGGPVVNASTKRPKMGGGGA